MDKKSLIMDAAMRCFAQKGYRATSIQEIADSLGIAKGSLYFYFKSKEDLLVSIIKQYIDKTMEDFWATIRDESAPARDRLYRQQMQSFRFYRNNKEFIRLLMQERLDLHDQLFEIIYAVRYQTLIGLQKLLIDVYGDAALPYSIDAATIYMAMSNEYMSYLIIDRFEMDDERVVKHMLQRMDDIMRGIMERGDEPLIRPERFLEMAKSMDIDKPSWKKDALIELRFIRELLESMKLDSDVLEEMISSAALIEEEIDKDVPRPVLVKGLTSLLKTIRHPDLKKHIQQLEQHLADRSGI